MEPIESHCFNSVASGCSRSSFLVVFLYLVKAASMMELMFEDGVGVWPAVDVDTSGVMVLATVRLLVMVVELSGKHEASWGFDPKRGR